MYRLYRPYSRFAEVMLAFLFAVLFVICLLAIFITVVAPKGADGASQIFGYELRIVATDSMDKCEKTDVSAYEIGSIPKDCMIAVELVPERETESYDWYSALEVGDVLTIRYAYAQQMTITHRITAITPKDDGTGYTIELAGDNKYSDESTLYQIIDTSDKQSRNYVIGKVVWKSQFCGGFVGAVQRIMKSFTE